MKRLIIFLIRKKLGLKLRETFQFVGQKSDAEYWFEKDYIAKCHQGIVTHSSVSINWLLDDNCEIVRI